MNDLNYKLNYNCICILCIKPHEIIINFLQKLNDYILKNNQNYDIYLLCDDNSKTYQDNNIKIIQINDLECESNSYINIDKIHFNRSIAWDKVLYYFCKNNNYKNYWFLEEDVFIPTVKTIQDIDNKYPDADLLSNSNGIKHTDNPLDWHWHLMKMDSNINDDNNKQYLETYIDIRNHEYYKHHPHQHYLQFGKNEGRIYGTEKYFFDLPWYSSMCCGVRISNKLLIEIEKFVKNNNTLAFHEFIFNTLAMKTDCIVENPKELSGIVYRHDWEINDIDNTILYHPIKDLNVQDKYRKLINK